MKIGHPHQFFAAKGDMNRLFLVRINPRPHNMAMLSAVFDVEDDGARLVCKAQCHLRPGDVVEILVVAQRTVQGIWIDRQVVEILAAFRQRFGLDLPFPEGTVQILRNRPPHIRNLGEIVIVVVEQMRCEILAAAPLRRKRDHPDLPSAIIR